MTTLSARFEQGYAERKRYTLDYTAQLTPGETILSVTCAVNAIGVVPGGVPTLVVNSIAILPVATGAVFYASLGGTSIENGFSWEAVFTATTSVGQIFTDVVQMDIVSKS